VLAGTEPSIGVITGLGFALMLPVGLMAGPVEELTAVSWPGASSGSLSGHNAEPAPKQHVLNLLYHQILLTPFVIC
jgi:hypothetical protein